MGAAEFKQPSSQFLRGLGFMALVVLCWSGWALSSRFGYQSTLNVYDIVFLRIATAGMLLLPFAIRYGLRVGSHGLRGALLLTCGGGVPYLLVAIGAFKFAPASHVGILNAVTILVAAAGGMLLLGEPRGKLRLFGLVLVIGGMTALMTSKPGATVGYELAWLGHLLFFIAGALWAGYTLLARAWQVSALKGAATVSVVSLACYVPVYVLFLPKGIHEASLTQILWQAGYQGVIANIVALMAYTNAIRLLGASSAAAFVPLVPVVVALLAMPLLGEIPNHQEWLGFITIGFGVLAASGTLDWWRGKWRARKAPAATQEPMG